MIADYESEERDPLLSAPRQYALTQEHKHLKEMKALTGLAEAPIFCPIVADFYSMAVVTVPLFAGELAGGMADIREIYKKCYDTPIVRYKEAPDEAGFLSAAGLSGRDGMEISVLGNEERILLVARYDNLGQGRVRRRRGMSQSRHGLRQNDRSCPINSENNTAIAENR